MVQYSQKPGFNRVVLTTAAGSKQCCDSKMHSCSDYACWVMFVQIGFMHCAEQYRTALCATAAGSSIAITLLMIDSSESDATDSTFSLCWADKWSKLLPGHAMFDLYFQVHTQDSSLLLMCSTTSNRPVPSCLHDVFQTALMCSSTKRWVPTPSGPLAEISPKDCTTLGWRSSCMIAASCSSSDGLPCLNTVLGTSGLPTGQREPLRPWPMELPQIQPWRCMTGSSMSGVS